MKHLLNLLAAVALLVWGTYLVRTGILRVFGANLRQLIAHSVSSRFTAVLSGIGVTAVVQSSTATALIVSSFVGQGLVGLPAALAVMLGADVGTSVMAVVFSMDLSWLSPLFIFVGVVLFISRKDTAVGRVGRVLSKIVPHLFRSYRQELGFESICLNDCVALVAALHPELFEIELTAVDVELSGELTRGATVFDRRRNREWRTNVAVATKVDVPAVQDCILRGLAAAGTASRS